MAGRNQHHVPQLIQRGFGRSNGKSTQVVVYRSDKMSFTTSTRNFGAERDFYATGADTLVDDLITEYESDLGGLVASLRAGDCNALDRKNEISDLIAHLEMRTKSLRNNIAETAVTTFELLDTWISDPKMLEKMISSYLHRNPRYLFNEAKKNTRDRNQAAKLAQQMKSLLPKLVPTIAPELAVQFSSALRSNSEMLKSLPRDTHLKVLKESVVPTGRAKKYRNFQFRYIPFPDDLLVLPDTMVTFKSPDGYRAMAGDLDAVSDILMPIASHMLVVGSRRDSTLIDYEQTVKALSSCAFEAFVAESEMDHLNELRGSIGSNAKLIAEAEMVEIFDEVFQEFLAS